MKQDIAERFAATAVEAITADQAHTIIQKFLESIASCAACAGLGNITWEYESTLDRPDGSQIVVPKGAHTKCPRCGNPSPDRAVRSDPDFVGWHCFAGKTGDDCRRSKNDKTPEHSQCDYRVLLPLDSLE